MPRQNGKGGASPPIPVSILPQKADDTSDSTMMQTFVRATLTVLLIATSVVSVLVDWNDSHVFHPDWHPHARFHDIVLLLFLVGLSLLAIWLLWRKGAEPSIAVVVAMGILLCFWGSFFAAAAIPGSSPVAHVGEEPARLLGIPLHTNMVIATVTCIATLICGALWWRHRPESAEASR